MAGVPARLYHYGAYMTPALIRQASGLRSYAAFAGILAPLGVFFTGLGAYALFGSFWGSWPGLAAAAALLLLPDGAQQGMQNTFLSYHWLTQISPSASYGLALVALAWLFVLLGCTARQPDTARRRLARRRDPRRLQAALLHRRRASASDGSASALRGSLGSRKRALWALSALPACAVTMVSVRRLPGVPIIRFDGSSAREIFALITVRPTRRLA